MRRGQAPGAAAAVAVAPSRTAAVLALVTSLLALLLVPTPADAAPDAGLEGRFVALINAERSAAGLPALRVAGDLTAVGRRHAARMATAQDLHHNPDLGGAVAGWEKVGENVGRGPDLDRIHAAFMASPGHRANVLDREWTEVGVGVEVVDGYLWVTELFRLPVGASAPAADPEPAPAATETGDDPPTDAAAPDAPAPASGPAPVAQPVSREPVAVRPQLDRVSVVLARLDAAAVEDPAVAAVSSAITQADRGHRPA